MSAPSAISAMSEVPPNDTSAEAALLSAVLSDPAQMDRLVGVIRPEDFYVGRHRALFELMLRQHADTGVVDIVTLRAGMSPELLRDCDGGAYLATLYAASMSGANALTYAEVITARSKQRALIHLAYELARCAREHQDPRSILEMAREHLSGVERQAGREPVTVASLLEDAFAEIGSSVAHAGISTGYVALDDVIGGFEPGQMVVIGGRPSMGKSALALNMALRLSANGVPVGYLSYEMTRKQIIRRALACYSGVSTSRLKGGVLLSDVEHDQLNQAAAILRRSSLVLDDTEGCTPEVMRARCRRLVQNHGARLLIVDHLHLMRPPERDRTVRSTTDSMTLISHAVKAMAVELQVPVIALCQLNREAAKVNRGATKARKWDDPDPDVLPPTLTDLRDSGALEQDADIAILLHREGYYTKANDIVAQVIVAKNRDGAVDTVKLGWQSTCQRFNDLTLG